MLRQKMLAFVQQTMAFVTSEVLEPNWRELEEKLRRVGTVDQMLEDHVGFLDTCLKESGLTKAELIDVRPPLPPLPLRSSSVTDLFGRSAAGTDDLETPSGHSELLAPSQGPERSSPTRS